MAEYLQQSQKIGFLIQPTGTHTQGTDDLVGVGTSTNAWENVQTSSATFFPFRAVTGVVAPNPNTHVTTLKEMSTNTMFAESSRLKVESKATLPSVTITAYATPKTLGAMLAGAFQEGQQVTTDPYQKIYSPADAELDFASGDGFLFSVAGTTWTKNDSIGDGWILQNAVVDSLKVTIDNHMGDADTRLAKMEITFIGQKLLEDQTLSNWSDSDNYIFNTSNASTDPFTLDLQFSGETALTDICYRNFEFNIANNIMSDCVASDGYAANLKRSNPEIKVTINIPHNNTTAGYLSMFQSGTPFSFTLENGYGTGIDYFLSFTHASAYLTEQIKTSEGDYIAQTLNGMLIYDVTNGWGSNGVVQLADGYDTLDTNYIDKVT